MTTVVTSSSSDRAAEIDQCLSMIAPSQPDESKFVGMLLLPRLLQPDDVESIKRVFHGMNFKFIERLLRSNQGENSEVPQPVLREIAVNVLACFARFDELAKSKPMAERVPGLSTILTPNDPTDCTKETFNILLCVGVSKDGLVKLLDPDVLKNIFEVLTETRDKKERELCAELVTAIYARATHHLNEKPTPSVRSATKYSLKTTIAILSNILKQDQEHLKFEALSLLAHILPFMPSEVMDGFKKENVTTLDRWLGNLRDGLRQLLSSKLGDKCRDQALVVTACLLRHFGPDWLFYTLKSLKKSGRDKGKQTEQRTKDIHADTHFPSLLIHLVAVETRVIVDDIHETRLQLHNQKAVTVDEAKRQRQENMLPVCYEILEATIQYLSSNFSEEAETHMDSQVLLKIRKVLSDTMNIVMEFLRFVQDTELSDDALSNDMIVQASMRIVALYLAEEGYELE